MVLVDSVVLLFVLDSVVVEAEDSVVELVDSVVLLLVVDSVVFEVEDSVVELLDTVVVEVGGVTVEFPLHGSTQSHSLKFYKDTYVTNVKLKKS